MLTKSVSHVRTVHTVSTGESERGFLVFRGHEHTTPPIYLILQLHTDPLEYTWYGIHIILKDV
jgi:hypothetical protein